MEAEAIDASQIEETVISILNQADMEHATELSVRAAASAELGLDLSRLLAHKKLVRRVLESYLLSMDEQQEDTCILERECGLKEPAKNELEFEDNGVRFICKLSERRGVSVYGARGNSFVSIRDYFPKHGKLVHSDRGISLSSEQWSAFRKSIPDIEAAITKMESQIRTEDAAKESRTYMTNSEIPVAQRPPPTYMTYSSRRGLIPIQTPRFDGKNYHCWVHLMEFFLKQMDILYVLTEPCPISPLHPEACSKWMDDDYLCRHNILNSLCDHLFERFSEKSNSAKELWNEIKLAYDDDVGTTRSHVNKYIQFQMVDRVPVLEQIQEFHKIADSITASGVMIDENFHVSAVISKLPLSWKDYRSKLMREEFLPLNMLMHRIALEEEARNRAKGEELSNMARDYTKREELLTKPCVEEPRNRKDGYRPKSRVWKRPGEERMMSR